MIAAGLAFTVVAGLWTTLSTGELLMLPDVRGWPLLAYGGMLFLMWWSMMMAMMLPTAAPALLTYAGIARKLPGAGSLRFFALGYAVEWSLFSGIAVVLQIATRSLIPLTGMMAVASHVTGGMLLVLAGLYQFTPLKQACLRHCQSPLFYLMHHWRKGDGGAFRMGLAHGLYCVGCCWVLMGLLFYGGVMELTWIVGLALYVAAEKLIPARLRFERAAGIILVAWGIWEVTGMLV